MFATTKRITRFRKVQKITLQDKIKINVSNTWMLKWSKMAVNSSFLFEISCPKNARDKTTNVVQNSCIISPLVIFELTLKTSPASQMLM